MRDAGGVRLPTTSLYVTVCVLNGVVLLVGALALLLLPVTVSDRFVLAEALLVLGGLVVLLAVEAVLLRRALAPVDRVIRQMGTVRLGGSGEQVAVTGSGPGAQLARSCAAMLDRLEAERRAGSARVLAAQEAERRRIAQELHDQVGQSLTVVLLGLKQLEGRAPADLREELALVRESARAGLDDVRRVARELRPGVLDDLGLHAALAALATDVSAGGGPVVRRTFGPGLPPLSPEAETVVYRVAQEALTNVLRHARASRVELSLLRFGREVVLEVRDDGVGLRAEEDGAGRAGVEGAGLEGMRDRAALVGASVAVVGAPGHGTVVTLRVPVGGAP